ncbi:hypothetical protein ES703_52255 [subsurface metagenome]
MGDDNMKLPQEIRNCYQSEYKDAGEGLKQISKAFDDWCAILTRHSIQAAYAIIAANWAVHGNAQTVLDNVWSKLSLASVFIFLSLNLLATRWMIKLHYKHCLYADADPQQWKKDFEDSKARQTAWPYTEKIQNLGVWLRRLKIWAPVLAAVLFIISLF